MRGIPGLAPTTVDIEKLVYGGEGLGRIDGQVVLAPFVLPGERVEITAERVKAGLLRGSHPRILAASEARVPPRCEYFGVCGGCHYQHATYELQLEQKQSILRETLQRLGGIGYEDSIKTISGEPWFYRNRIQLHFVEGESGFHRAGTHEICAIDHCYISSPVLVDVIEKLAYAAKHPQWPPFLRSLEVFTNQSAVQLNIVDSARPVSSRFFDFCGTFLPSLSRSPLQYDAAGCVFRISRGSFFQVNRFLIDSLVEEVVHDYTGSYAVDLFSGVGLFSLPLSARFKQVDAVERGASGFRDLEANAVAHNALIRAHKQAAEDFLRALDRVPELIIADPPRAGLGRDLTSELTRILPANIALVSCDPSTLARDLKTLSAKYKIRRLTMMDLFPQTYHFEAVVHLERN
jgi:23S rRNA (uracil1939-C5)-methyltransferase